MIYCSTISADGKLVVSGLDNGSVRVLDAQTGTATGEALTGHNRAVWSVAVSSDGARIVSGSLDNTVRIWDVEAGDQVGSVLQGHTDDVNSVAFSSDGKHVVSGSNDGTIRIWNIETGEQPRTLLGHDNWVLSVATNGTHVVSGSADSTVRIWDFETGDQVGGPLTGHTDLIWSVVISDTRGWIISGSSDRTVRIWDVQTRSLIKQFDAEGEVYSVAVSEEGNKIAAAAGNVVLIWDMNALDAKPLLLRSLINGPVKSVALSRDGQFLSVSGREDMTMRVCDLDIERIVAGNTTLRDVLDRRTDVLTSLTTNGKRLLHRLSSLPFLLARIVFWRSAFAKIDSASATVLQFFHDTYTSDDVDADQQHRSIEVLLINALALCRPTETDRETFADFSLRGVVIESGKRVPVIHKAAKEVLKKFGTGGWLKFLRWLDQVTDLLPVDCQCHSQDIPAGFGLLCSPPMESKFSLDRTIGRFEYGMRGQACQLESLSRDTKVMSSQSLYRAMEHASSPALWIIRLESGMSRQASRWVARSRDIPVGFPLSHFCQMRSTLSLGHMTRQSECGMRRKASNCALFRDMATLFCPSPPMADTLSPVHMT
jgi:tricorn protease-like protein